MKYCHQLKKTQFSLSLTYFKDIFFMISVGTPIGYGLEGRSKVPGKGKRFFSLLHSVRLWDPASPIFNGNRGLVPRGIAGGV
jgi:hypothetical protein